MSRSNLIHLRPPSQLLTRVAQVPGYHRSVNSVYRPWLSQANGYCESFNSKLREVFWNGEFFYSMKELSVLAERWSVHHNTVGPDSSLGYDRPVQAALLTKASQGHEEEGSKVYFPLFNTPDYCDELSLLAAAPR